MTRIYPIYTRCIEAMKEAINKVNKKIDKANAKSDLGISMVECTFSAPSIDDKGRSYCEATITVPELSQDYTYIGMIDHVDNMVFAEVDGHTSVLEKYRNNCTCDHCKKDINRNTTYVHLNEQTKEYIHVGGSCSKNYFRYPMNIVHMFIDMFIIIDGFVVSASNSEPKDISGYRFTQYYPLSMVLHTSYKEVKNHGYTKEEFFGDPACTKNAVKNAMGTTFCSMTSDLDVKGLVEYINQKDESEYINNIKAILNRLEDEDIDSIGVSYKQVGMFPYIIFDYLESLKKHISTGYYGNVKDKIDIECILHKTSGYESQFGYTYVYTFITDDGCHLIWKTSTWLNRQVDRCSWTNIPDGTRVKLKGTIKAHNIYRDEMQTIVTRCKVTEL